MMEKPQLEEGEFVYQKEVSVVNYVMKQKLGKKAPWIIVHIEPSSKES